MEPGPEGDPPAAQGLPHLLAVPPLHAEGEHPALNRRVLRLEGGHAGDGTQALSHASDEPGLLGGDILHPQVVYIAQALQQAGDAGHVVGARLQAVGQEVGHGLPPGLAARAPSSRGAGSTPHSSRPVP